MISNGISFRKMAGAAAIGSVQGAVVLVGGHPFDVWKTRAQVTPQNQSIIQVARIIFQERGIKGYYSGLGPNSVRVIGKQAYRPPLLLLCGAFSDRLFSPGSYVGKAAFQSCVMANLEVGIITPLERLKVWYITQQPEKKKLRYLLAGKTWKQVFVDSYSGLSAVWLKQLLSWSSFLVTNAKLQQLEKQRIGQEKLPFASEVRVALYVGGINTFLTLPLDRVKTGMQQAGASTNASFAVVAKEVFQQHGVANFWRGAFPRGIQYMLQAVVFNRVQAMLKVQ